MPQCKINGCREQAQKYGKRLCPEHEASRAAKAKAYRSKPLCEFCRTQHTLNVDEHFGKPECPTCRNARWDRELEQEKANAVINELYDCATLEELKAFVHHNLLNSG